MDFKWSSPWATPFEFHTPPVEDLKKHLTQGECEFQVDNLVWHFKMKYLLPL